MSQQALLKRVAEVLGTASISYMLTGSLVSSLQGEPRATHDIDLVIEVGDLDVPRLLKALTAPDLYLDGAAVAAAVHERTSFNLIEPSTGDKVDFWPLTDDPFDSARFARRQWVEALGLRLAVSAPEDTILMKLRWARESGGSEKQLTDALRVYELQAARLDAGYLAEWADRLGVDDLLTRLREQARPLGM
jgi:hypothetical protein